MSDFQKRPRQAGPCMSVCMEKGAVPIVYLTKLFGTVDALGLYVSFNTIFSQIGGSDGSHSHRFDSIALNRNIRCAVCILFFFLKVGLF